MTISITTTRSSESTTPSQVFALLNRLHKNGLRGLHYSYNQNNTLMIHVENRELEHELMRTIDSDKAGAVAHFQNTYFNGVECQVNAIQRFAFLPRGTSSFVHLLESTIKDAQSGMQSSDRNALALERMQSINRRQLIVAGNRSSRASDFSHFDPSSSDEEIPHKSWLETVMEEENFQPVDHREQPFGFVPAPTSFHSLLDGDPRERRQPWESMLHQHHHHQMASSRMLRNPEAAFSAPSWEQEVEQEKQMGKHNQQ